MHQLGGAFLHPLLELLFQFTKGIIDLTEVGDVDTGSNVARESAVRSVARAAGVQDPPILAIRSPQAVFHSELPAQDKSGEISVQAMLKIFRMHGLRPTASQLHLHCPPGELQPSLVEKCA